MNRLICSYCNFNSLHLFNFSDFTSLNMKILKIAKNNETNSAREIASIGRLSMLSESETKELVIAKENILTDNDLSLSGQDFSFMLQRTAWDLHNITGGHPRSFDTILRLMKSSQKKYIYRSTTRGYY